jgi:hypothetical protein
MPNGREEVGYVHMRLRKVTHVEQNVKVARQSMCPEICHPCKCDSSHFGILCRWHDDTPLPLHLRRTMFVCFAMYWPLRHVFAISW